MGTNSTEKKRVTQKTKTNSKNRKSKSKMDLSETNKKKKLWSFDALKEAMQPSAEELEYREDKAKDSDFVQKYSKLFKCTKCQLSIKPLIVKNKGIPVHPCLGVLMCQKCCDYYEDGEFSLDSDGEDKYCRWCGEGGTIFSCSNCICGFCANCIKRHFSTEYFKQVQKDENWLCFFCNPKPLWDHRFIYSLALKLSESSKQRQENKPSESQEEEQSESSTTESKQSQEENITKFQDVNSEESDTVHIQEDVKTDVKTSKRKKLVKSRKRGLRENGSRNVRGKQNMIIYTSSSDESDLENPFKKIKYSSTPLMKFNKTMEDEVFEKKKSSVLKELKKILSLSEHQMEFGVTWSNNMLEKMATPDYVTTTAGLVKECQKIKHVLSFISSFLVQFSNSVHSIETVLQKNTDPKVHVSPDKDKSAYTNILRFLGFVRGQVKAFMEKGINLPDIFEAEVYDDEKVIGIKKKLSCSPCPSRNKLPGSSNFKSNCGIENKKIMEQNKVEELDKIRDDDILEFVGDQSMEKNDFETEDESEFKDINSSNTTFAELSELKCTPDPKDDIREILAILENA